MGIRTDEVAEHGAEIGALYRGVRPRRERGGFALRSTASSLGLVKCGCGHVSTGR